MIVLDCAQYSSRIAPLHGNRDPLEEELEGTWLSCFCLEAVSKFAEEMQGLRTTDSCSFYGHWNEVVTSFQLSVLRTLPLFRLSCYSACFSGRQQDVGGSIGVRTGYVPHQDPARLPRHDCGSIGSFPIRSTDAGWFQVRWHPYQC